jgi:hypothetical protein
MKTMLKKLLIIVQLFCSMNLFAQEKFSEYDNSYIGERFEIQLSAKEQDKFTLYIDAMSLDKLHSKGGIRVEEKNHSEFIEALSQARIKYEEWVATAKENNVKELVKAMTIKSRAGGYFLYGSEWNFQFSVNLQFDFKILESNGETKYLLLIRTGELQSSSNQFMKVDGFVLVFTNAKEIDDFIGSISADKISAFQNKPKKEDLFKD